MFQQEQFGQQPGLISEEERARRLRELRAQREENQRAQTWQQAMEPQEVVAGERAVQGPQEVTEEWLGPTTPVGPQDPQGDVEAPEDRTLGDVVKDTGRAVVRGAAGAVNETTSFFTFGKFRPIDEDRLPEIESDHGAYQFVEGMSQFLTGMVGAGKVLKPLQLGRRAYRVMRGAGIGKRVAKPVALMVPAEAASVVTDFVAFNPYEERLADLVASSGPEFARPIGEWLASNEDDPELWARTKAAMEGAMVGLALGATIEGATRLVRIVGLHKRFKRGSLDDETTKRLARETADAEFDYDDAIAIYHGKDESVLALRNVEDLELDPTPFIHNIENIDPGDIGEFMWHAGTKGKDILREGLKSRHQLGGQSGLGGGSVHTVSVTYSREHAENIHEMQRLVTRIAKNEASIDDVVEHFEFYWWEDLDLHPIIESLEPHIGRNNVKRLLGVGEDSDWEDFLLRKGVNEDDHLTPIQYMELEAEAFADAWRQVEESLPTKDAQEALMKLATELDAKDPEPIRRTLIVHADGVRGIIDQFAQYDLEDLNIFQVGARKGVQPIELRPLEADIPHPGQSTTLPLDYEIQLHPDDVEHLDRIINRNERQTADLDTIIRAREGSVRKLPQAKIEKAVKEYRKALDEGADYFDLQQQWGINLGHLVKNYEDTKVLSKAVEEALKKEHMGARFLDSAAPKTYEELHERALTKFKEVFGNGATLDDLRNWAADLGSSNLDEAAVNLDAGFMVLHALAGDISRVARALDLMDGPEAVGLQGLLEEMVEAFADIQLRVLGGRSESGRLLNFMKKAGQLPSEVGKAAQEALQAGAETAGGRSALTPAQARELARNLRMAEGNPELIRKVLEHTVNVHRNWDNDPRLMDKINWFRTNMLLSGPKTFLVNAISNAITLFQVPVEHMWAGLRSGNRELVDYGRDEIGGIFSSISEAFSMARKSWTSDMNILDPSFRTDDGLTAMGPSPLNTIGQWAKTMVGVPGRALMATDEFFKQHSYRGHVLAQAKATAREDAVTRGLRRGTKEFHEYVAKRAAEALEGAFTKEGHALNPFALENSRYVTFQNELGYGFGQTIQRAVNEHPFLRFILPFVRTPVNLFRFTWQRTPVLGRFQRQLREDLAAGGYRAEIAKARLEAGWVLWGSAAVLAMGGHITGGGPFNPNVRKQWRDLGNQPYSFRLPSGEQISFHRGDPQFTPLGIIADAVEAAGELGEEDATQVGFAVATAIAASATSKTFLTGLSEVFEALGDGHPEVVKRTLTNMATSFTPNFLNQINADEVFREARSLVDEFRRRLPGFSDQLEPRRNLFGEPVLKPAMAFGMEFGGVGDYVNRFLNPFTTMKVEEDWVTFLALTDLGMALPYPQLTRMEG